MLTYLTKRYQDNYRSANHLLLFIMFPIDCLHLKMSSTTVQVPICSLQYASNINEIHIAFRLPCSPFFIYSRHLLLYFLHYDPLTRVLCGLFPLCGPYASPLNTSSFPLLELPRSEPPWVVGISSNLSSMRFLCSPESSDRLSRSIDPPSIPPWSQSNSLRISGLTLTTGGDLVRPFRSWPSSSSPSWLRLSLR